MKLLRAAIGVPEPGACGGSGPLACGDVDLDGALTVADVVLVLATLSGSPTLFGLCPVIDPPLGCAGPAGVSRHAATDGNLHWSGQTTRSGTITTNQVWPSGCRVNLSGTVFVKSGVTLTIQPGAIVAGASYPPTSLVVLRGAKINAAGTAAQPIVMTSGAHLDTDAGGHPGDWDGLVINGSAPVNCPGGECLANGLVGVPLARRHGERDDAAARDGGHDPQHDRRALPDHRSQSP